MEMERMNIAGVPVTVVVDNFDVSLMCQEHSHKNRVGHFSKQEVQALSSYFEECEIAFYLENVLGSKDVHKIKIHDFESVNFLILKEFKRLINKNKKKKVS